MSRFISMGTLHLEGSNILSVSGGKDSTCMYLLAMEHGIEFTAVFADVGNEHPATVEYVNTLAERTGGPEVEVVRADMVPKFERKRQTISVKWREQGVPEAVVERALKVMHPTGNVFLDACLLHGGFPASNRRWCTQDLKVTPIWDQCYRRHWERGEHVLNWQAVRAEESNERSQMQHVLGLAIPRSINGRRLPGKCGATIFRPLLDWREGDVFQMHRRHGIRPNPLYERGMRRVGCFPCVMVSKEELATIAAKFPDAIDRIEDWEEIVNQATRSRMPETFVVAKKVMRSEYDPMKVDLKKHGIRGAVEHANLVRGSSNQMNLLAVSGDRPNILEADDDLACGMYGACE